MVVPRKLNAEDYKDLIRLMYSKPVDSRQPCLICGKYQAITHMHHVIPVSQMSKSLEKLNPDAKYLTANLKIRYVWLCPNHHALFHKFNGRDGNELWGDARLELIEEIGWDEYKTMQVVFNIYQSAYDEFREIFITNYEG